MPNFKGSEDLCKLNKEYLTDLLCKFGPFCLQRSKTFDISHAFLRVTIAELSMLKQVWFFWSMPYFRECFFGGTRDAIASVRVLLVIFAGVWLRATEIEISTS